MTMKVFYSDLRDCRFIKRNLLYALLQGWVEIAERNHSYVTVEASEDILNSLYEQYPTWLRSEAYNMERV